MPLVLLVLLLAAAQAQHGLLLSGQEAEEFLKTARVTENRSIPVGITGPRQVTLTDGAHTLRAAWKTVDEHRRGFTDLERGGKEWDFTDSYKYEIAAYELDKILGLDLVPPSVERRLDGERGALVLWVEGSVTEYERKKRGLRAPDPDRWNAQMYKVRLLHNLTYNTDHGNIRNILIDPDFGIYAIDHSRAFRTQRSLLAEKDLDQFSRAVLEKLRLLDRALLQQKLGAWLSPNQIEAILARGERILKRAEKLVAERGEARVLYP